jgi:hypothetical protein
MLGNTRNALMTARELLELELAPVIGEIVDEATVKDLARKTIISQHLIARGPWLQKREGSG